MGILSAAVGGAGEGAFSSGRIMQSYGGQQSLQEQASQAQALRDQRLEEYASAREQRGYAHSEALQKGSFAHAENMQAGQQDFQSAENFLTREQHSEEGALNRASHERIARLGRDAQTAIAGMHGTVQVGQDGKILWVGPQGKVVDTGYSGPKDLSGTAKVAADILRDQLKGIDKSESDGMGNPQVIAQQRLRVQGQLLAVLSGDLEGAFKAPKITPPPGAIDALTKNPNLAGDFDAKYGQGSSASFLTTVQPPQGPRAQPTRGLLNSDVQGGGAPGPSDDAGAALDAARAASAAARTKVQSYGVVQQRRDPQGYVQAQQALEQAMAEQADAERAWNAAAGTPPAARMRTY